MKRMIIFTSILIFLFIIAGCSDESVGGAGERYNIATASSGGTVYPLGTALSQLLTENIEGVNISSSSSAGSVENISLLGTEESHLAFVQSDIAMEAFTGTGQFEGEEPMEDLRVITPISTTFHHIIVRKDANIESISDLEGKRFVTGRPGSGGAKTSEDILNSFNLTTDDIIAEPLGQGEAADALINGQIDGAFLDGALGFATLSELLVSAGDEVEILNFSHDEVNIISEDYSHIEPMEIPADTYPDQSEDITTTAHFSYFVMREDTMSEEEVYSMLQIMFDNQDSLIQAQNTFDNPAFTEPWNYIENLGLPLHNGADRFFKEHGN